MNPTVYPNYPRAADKLPDGDPLGRAEMVDLLRRSAPSVSKWIERGTLPPADGPTVNGGPTWRRRTLLAWAYRMEFTLDAYTKHPLPCHEEAAEWAEAVPGSATIPARYANVPPEAVKAAQRHAG